MRFGCCVNMLPWKTAADWRYYIHAMAQMGYDYADLPLADLMEFSDRDISLVESALREAGIRALNWNRFIPDRFQITGEKVTAEKEIQKYLEEAFSVIGSGGFGAEAAVFGSPWNRVRPDGFSMDRAHEQIADVLRMAAGIAEKNGIIVAVENNNHTETNTMLHLPGVAEIVRKIALPNVRILCDYYHLRVDEDPMDDILSCGDRIVHCHVAKRKNRAYVADIAGEEEFLYAFARNLKKCGYDNTLSIEGKTTREKWMMEAEASLKLLREIFGADG